MGKITQLKQGSLSGLRRQTNECLDSAYNKGYEDGAKNQDEVQYQKGYNKGFEDGKAEATYNTDLIDELKQVEYIRGLEDANHAMSVLTGMTDAERAEWFIDCLSVYGVVCGFTVQQIVEIINAYEEKKNADEESIKVGDEIVCNCPNEQRVIITSICDGWVTFMRKDGACYSRADKDLKKTGRHFDEVEQLLHKLGDENND